MRKQEAIEYMRMYKGENVNGESHLGHAFDLSDEIIDMAIEALKYMADEEQFWSEQYQDIDDYPDTDGDAIRYLDGLRSEITDTGSYEYNYLTMAIEALRDDDYQKRILTPEERSEVLNAIDDALNGYQVDGYEDTDGMFFKVLISKVERGDSDDD